MRPAFAQHRDQALVDGIGGAQGRVTAFADDRQPAARRARQQTGDAESGAGAEHGERAAGGRLSATDPPQLVGASSGTARASAAKSLTTMK